MTETMTAAEFRKAGKPSKYHNRVKVVDGVRYDSEWEAQTAIGLALRMKAADIEWWMHHVPFTLYANGKKLGEYIADFVVRHHDASMEIIEAKGYWTPIARWKMKHVQAQYPHIKVTILRQSKA